ncbi:MAG TPA: SDR family oxidoreductase [Thermomicrobiales bacterium]|nr:SDR family oxidoreductase [Thermomicrobiales bacterium]
MMNNSLRRLDGKTALVTGSTRGLGRTIAEWLAREGADVIVSGREAGDVEASVQALNDLGSNAFGIAADLANLDDTDRLAEEALAHAPALDILVNNAGMSIRQSFWEVTRAQFDEQVNVNWRSPFVLNQTVAKHMIDRGIRGRIVNISTIGARACHTDALVYDAAKGAVEVMTRNMAYELGPYGISVNCVAPGNIADRPGTTYEEWWDQGAAKIPLGRIGRADDIAAAVLFFCLPETGFTTGQTLLVDGAHDSYLPEF